MATGVNEDIISKIQQKFNNNELVDDFYHELLINSLTKYIVIGGMPNVVLKYIKTNNMNDVFIEQNNILNAYRRDIEKYVDSNGLKIKIFACFDSIPQQLSKDKKKFQYKLVKSGGNARYFESSIDWIVSCGLAHKCYKINSIQSPIKFGVNNSIFKLYLNDIGLLSAMYGSLFQTQLLNGDIGIAKGAFYEQLIAQMLIANNIDLYYYEGNGTLEIDFVTENESGVLPIEVKSGFNTKSQSLKSFINKYNPKYAIKLSKNNVNCTNDVIKSYPLYMAMFINAKLKSK